MANATPPSPLKLYTSNSDVSPSFSETASVKINCQLNSDIKQTYYFTYSNNKNDTDVDG